MDGLTALFLAASLALAPGSQATGKDVEVWRATWSDLARLAATPAGSPERERLWRALDAFQRDHELAGHKASDRAEALRARVLRFHLTRINGGAPRPVAEPGATLEFLPGEAWLAFQALEPGPTRSRAAAAALAEVRGEELRTRAERARDAVEEDARELHLDWALEEARSLRENAAETWTAVLLARTLRLRGEYEQAERALDAPIELAADRGGRALLFAERARARSAAGADEPALSDLGSALANGSPEAALELGLRALAEGESTRARAAFRSLTAAPGPPPNLPLALRAYGLALLAEPPRNPPDRPH